MTIKEALRKLAIAKKKEANSRLERIKLSKWLLSNGFDLDGSKARAARNKIIYKSYLKGISYKEIAEKVNLSASQCSTIAMREEILARKKLERKGIKK